MYLVGRVGVKSSVPQHPLKSSFLNNVLAFHLNFFYKRYLNKNIQLASSNKYTLPDLKNLPRLDRVVRFVKSE